MTNDANEGNHQPIQTRAYQQEMLEASLKQNIIIAMDTGSGKTHIAVLRLKAEMDRAQGQKISWFLAPTVALCEQQLTVIAAALPASVGIISGASEPNQWKNSSLWARVMSSHRVMVSTPQVLLDALRHGFILLGRDISLLIFDEAHHAVDNHPYNRIMQEFYFRLPRRIDEQSLPNDNTRPMVLGLTASPIYGGDIVKAFRSIEGNLDSVICTPRQGRAELEQHVYRPTFRYLVYSLGDEPFSTNLATLEAIIRGLNIEHDPYVISLRQQLSSAMPGSDSYRQLDQKLSQVILKEKSFTHKGLKDFARAAEEIRTELGTWAADWYVWKVLSVAKAAAVSSTMMPTWHNKEKRYLFGILERINVVEPSYHPDDLTDELSSKFLLLVDSLLREKEECEEGRNEAYSGIIFVRRRDVVLALTELLSHHPLTKDVFSTGFLLGTSDTSQRHSFMDITTKIRKEPQDVTLRDFRNGDKNLIISTSVAEEGIDIQACNSVIRWDAPPNFVSWAQSRGRARKRESTFTILMPEGWDQASSVTKWMELEGQMVKQYANRLNRLMPDDEYDEDIEEEMGEENLEFHIPETGALLTLQSVIPHLSHFCAVIPNSGEVDFRPIYEIDPPDLPLGWHSDSSRALLPTYQGPYGATLCLPRTLPSHLQKFTVDRVYPTKLSAFRQVAFKAYITLYHEGLLDENLLPLSDRDEEIERILQDVEARKGMASVQPQFDPWIPGQHDSQRWYLSVVSIDGLPPLQMFTATEAITMAEAERPMLFMPGSTPLKVSIDSRPHCLIDDVTIQKARDWTMRLFWCINGSRMKWEEQDFAYLFLPCSPSSESGVGWLHENDSSPRPSDAYNANAEELGRVFSYPDDLHLIRDGTGHSKLYEFLNWHHDPLSMEEEEDLQETYRKRLKRCPGLQITISYPILAVRRLPTRTNFLVPSRSAAKLEAQSLKPIYLLPQHSSVVLLSKTDARYSFLLPSILRALEIGMTAKSFRDTLFSDNAQLKSIPWAEIAPALTAPTSQEENNYQRLETLGDAVLKLVTSVNLLGEHPLWHEGYVSRKKDHSVANVRLAKENIERSVYLWIIRDRLLGKKWKPRYLRTALPTHPELEAASKDSSKTGKEELSTKVLADVIEAVIGSAYVHGGLDLGYECIKSFKLGIEHWQPLQDRFDQMLEAVDQTHRSDIEIPPAVNHVEKMLGYNFSRKFIAIEALTHASLQQDYGTVSYERLELLGDSVLDMIVTDYIYRAPGKRFSPGHMFLKKAAMVNAHTLAYACLSTMLQVTVEMAGPDVSSNTIAIREEEQTIHLWQCLLHSSHRVLEEQRTTIDRFLKWQPEIENGFRNDTIFPWAALIRVQAAKWFSDMIESLIGAVYLDSQGNIETVCQVLRKLGLWQVLERVVKEEVDVLHPVSRVSIYAAKQKQKIEYKIIQEAGHVSCKVLVNGEELQEASTTELHTGKSSRNSVKLAAAEKTIRLLHLRQ